MLETSAIFKVWTSTWMVLIIQFCSTPGIVGVPRFIYASRDSVGYICVAGGGPKWLTDDTAFLVGVPCVLMVGVMTCVLLVNLRKREKSSRTQSNDNAVNSYLLSGSFFSIPLRVRHRVKNNTPIKKLKSMVCYIRIFVLVTNFVLQQKGLVNRFTQSADSVSSMIKHRIFYDLYLSLPERSRKQ